jgi:hypothetical protein
MFGGHEVPEEDPVGTGPLTVAELCTMYPDEVADFIESQGITKERILTYIFSFKDEVDVPKLAPPASAPDNDSPDKK